MLQIFKGQTNYDFIGKAPTWIRISIVTFVIGVLILIFKGANFGLDFTGGHELLMEFKKTDVTAEQVRAKLDDLKLGETSVQSYGAEAGKVDFLVRVQRTSTFAPEELTGIENAFKQKYGQYMSRIRYNPDAGDVVELELTETASIAQIDTSSAALGAVIAQTNHTVRTIRQVGRPDQPRFSIVLRGIDEKVVRSMQELDPEARATKVEFVGPTVGQQLRDDGILAIVVALGMILFYIAVRFDFFFAPGAVICLAHDAVITVAMLSALGEEFSLTTIAAVLTLVGYSVEDTIIVFDRIREVVGKAQGAALKDIVNRATNETLARTILTSSTVMFSCLCLMIFGRGTVLFQFGLVMFVGVVFGTYSSIYVAAPIYIWLRERFDKPGAEEDPRLKKKVSIAREKTAP